MKVAKLATVSLTTRVIVEDTTTDEQIMNLATPKFIDKLQNNEALENLESIIDDEECPYGTLEKKMFILGYPSGNVDAVPENLVEYKNKKEADFESEEWVEVEANTLEEAKAKYEETFLAWQERTK